MKQPTSEWTCETCFKTYTKIDSYKHHIIRHQKSNFLCSLCDHQFPTETELKTHHARNHVPKDQATVYQCSDCIYTATSKATLNAHISRTHKEKKYFCDFCPKGFALKSDLTTHLKFHKS